MCVGKMFNVQSYLVTSTVMIGNDEIWLSKTVWKHQTYYRGGGGGEGVQSQILKKKRSKYFFLK